MIGVLIGDVSFDFSEELMTGISDAAVGAEVQVMFLLGMQKHLEPVDAEASDASIINHNSVYDYACLTGADAFIIACGSLTGFSGDGPYKRFLDRFNGVPYVVLQERIEIDSPEKTYIVIDNYRSFTQCVEHLIVQHGYRKIALVSGPEGHADARERLRAYQDCLRRHGLPASPELIAAGDYYEFVDDLVSGLIDANPGLEAIAFANDEMAKAGYRECRRRGLAIGRDIAITGFDNFNSGRTMEPPLTTVSQDAYKMGKLALEQAIRLIDGKEAKPIEMETEFLPRLSCGCTRKAICLPPNSADADPGAYIDFAIDGIIDGFADHFASEEHEQNVKALYECFRHLRSMALDHPLEAADPPALTRYLDEFFGRYDQPALLLTQCLEEFIQQFLCSQRMSPEVRKFEASLSYMQQYVGIREMRALEERFVTYRAQSWFASELTRGLFAEKSDLNVLHSVAERLLSSGLRHVYICLTEKPQRHGVMGLASVPPKLLLAAQGDDMGTIAYPRAEMPVIDADYPLRSLPGFQQISSMMGFSIFSGENQYGILLCEADKSKNTLLHVIGLQLGMLMDFLELRRKEKAITEELGDIREKNEILNFLSEYDQMCGLLNRRGFIERAISRNRENIGKTAYCAFLDLDYLKQINDTFGHSEGDIAIRAVSGILQNVAKEDDLIARIGGDEFVGLFITEDARFEERFSARFHEECTRYNAQADRPYLLDVSVGIARFVCRQGFEISSIIGEADKHLYQAKHKRSFSSLRSNPLAAIFRQGTGKMDNP